MSPLTKSQIVTDCEEVFEAVCEAKRAGCRIGLVPTMGALHEGHLSLVRAARNECDFVVVTVFVNPTQFGPNEDFAAYPRNLDADLEALAAFDVDLVFAPAYEALYPPGFSTFIEPPAVALPLEGQCRPGHFRGVATIVFKLFHLVPADIAFFGQKDYQQSLVVRRMVEDLNLPINIHICPTVREDDGLALSSRNAYLNPAERQQAAALSASLKLAGQMAEQHETSASIIRDKMQQVLAEAGVTQVDYVAVVDPNTLEELEMIDGPAMALVAAHVGTTRLIDNCQIGSI